MDKSRLSYFFPFPSLFSICGWHFFRKWSRHLIPCSVLFHILNSLHSNLHSTCVKTKQLLSLSWCACNDVVQINCWLRFELLLSGNSFLSSASPGNNSILANQLTTTSRSWRNFASKLCCLCWQSDCVRKMNLCSALPCLGNERFSSFLPFFFLFLSSVLFTCKLNCAVRFAYKAELRFQNKCIFIQTLQFQKIVNFDIISNQF